MPEPLRTIAFYLPQFHPIPENDEWWGTGYTEWTRVVRATPQFRGHHQPHLPGELGFYDLRLPEVRAAQARLAKAHHIDAFCYYYYWFAGRRLLERPLEEVRSSGLPAFPFLLCWANEPWTRSWDGRSGAHLIDQREEVNEAARFARDLIPAFSDSRYLRIDGRPVFLVYRANRLPDPRRITATWRQVIVRAGLPEPYLCRVESMPDERGDPTTLGFDAAVEFQPDWSLMERTNAGRSALRAARRRARSLRAIQRRHRVIPYHDVVDFAVGKPEPGYPWFRCVCPGWDNTARRSSRATILDRADPATYGEWVEASARRTVQSAVTPAPLLFVNAWNEWGEGCHLEPCARYGRDYLENHRDAIDRVLGR